jgi:short-subunit dehydrogenase
MLERPLMHSTVYCLDRLEKPEDEFSEVRDRLAPIYGGVLEYRQMDVRNTENVEDVIARIAETHFRLDGLVAAAGIQKVIPALDFQPSDIEEILSVNYTGVYVSTLACARQMIKYRIPGSLLLVASMFRLIANKGFKSSVYNSSGGGSAIGEVAGHGMGTGY